jgi:hypothetical protein
MNDDVLASWHVMCVVPGLPRMVAIVWTRTLLQGTYDGRLILDTISFVNASITTLTNYSVFSVYVRCIQFTSWPTQHNMLLSKCQCIGCHQPLTTYCISFERRLHIGGFD